MNAFLARARVSAANYKECWLESRPERGTTCLDKGSYVINFKGCHACGKRDFIAEEGRVEDEDDDEEDGCYEEIITYNHVCKHCAHVICAEHYYKFEVSADGTQSFLMECALCGRGADHVPGSSYMGAATATAAAAETAARSGGAAAAAAAAASAAGAGDDGAAAGVDAAGVAAPMLFAPAPLQPGVIAAMGDTLADLGVAHAPATEDGTSDGEWDDG